MNKKIVLVVLLVLLVGGVGVAWSRNPKAPLDTETVATSTSTQITNGAKTTSNDSLPLLRFTVPQTGMQIKAVDGVDLEWSLTDPSLKQLYPNKDTYIYLQLLTEKGGVVGVAGPAPSPHLGDAGTHWNIQGQLTQEFYKITPGEKYKLKATLVYEPQDYTCDPKATDNSCWPVYPPTEQALVDKAKKYQSESGLFTISLDGYVHPAVTIDQDSLTISSSNASIRGTATSNVTAIKADVWVGANKTETIVPVQNGTWSYTPAFPTGTYQLQLWDTTSAAYFPSATFTVSK